MTPIGLWIRRDARRRVRSLVVLALLVAVAGGVVLATTAGARRNGSVLPRALRITAPSDALVLPNRTGVDWDAVRRFPEVAAVGELVVTSLTVDGIPTYGAPIGFPQFRNFLFHFRAGADRDAVVARLSDAIGVGEITPGLPLEDQQNLGRVLQVPAYLGAFLALANALAAWPGRNAARTRPAEVLRVE